ncbi:MAG: AAA family ATPase, partial [Clostridium sp.]|nr:AAA family ATPase [Clostridium sp.]
MALLFRFERANILNISNEGTEKPQIILFYSGAGGVGKTTISMGVAAYLAQNYKRVLYINAARLQMFQNMLGNPA